MKDKMMQTDLPDAKSEGTDESQDSAIHCPLASKLAELEVPAGAELTKVEAERRHAFSTWTFEGGSADAMTECQARMAVGGKIAGKVGALVRITAN